jgi:hypothetical protein
MKVKELVALLQKQNQDKEVLVSGDDWFYDTIIVREAYVSEGREVNNPSTSDETVVVIE